MPLPDQTTGTLFSTGPIGDSTTYQPNDVDLAFLPDLSTNVGYT